MRRPIVLRSSLAAIATPALAHPDAPHAAGAARPTARQGAAELFAAVLGGSRDLAMMGAAVGRAGYSRPMRQLEIAAALIARGAALAGAWSLLIRRRVEAPIQGHLNHEQH